jgi:hypothetical protein
MAAQHATSATPAAAPKPLNVADGAKKVTLQFRLGSSSAPSKISFFAPVTRADFNSALSAVFSSCYEFGAVQINGETFAINDKLINSVLLANPDKVFTLVANHGGGKGEGDVS